MRLSVPIEILINAVTAFEEEQNQSKQNTNCDVIEHDDNASCMDRTEMEELSEENARRIEQHGRAIKWRRQ